MRTTVHLLRHGEVHNPDKVLYGRLPGFRLSELGHEMAQRAAQALSARDVTAVIASPLERAQQTFYVFIGSLVIGFTLLGILLNVMLHYVVIKPLRNVSAKADEVSMGGLNVEELQITGQDEVASIGRSFNRMHRSLNNALKMLDDDD